VRALVVGSSGGLGLALVAQLNADKRYTQIITWSRSTTVLTGEKILANHIDLRDESTIAAAAQSLDEVDLAIVATGLLHDGDLKPEKSWNSIEPSAMLRAFEINTVGPALIAKHVLPLLPRDRRAVFGALSARVGSIGDNRLGGWHSYRASKAALNQLIRCFSIELSAKRPLAICVGLHPGTVDTDLSKPYQAGVPKDKLFSPEQSARRLLQVIDCLTPSQSGRVYDWAGLVIQA
jgi:NAD(P)-dependent dehydrogenase (short-subunit alcohol dehydrogenase family)